MLLVEWFITIQLCYFCTLSVFYFNDIYVRCCFVFTRFVFSLFILYAFMGIIFFFFLLFINIHNYYLVFFYTSILFSRFLLWFFILFSVFVCCGCLLMFTLSHFYYYCYYLVFDAFNPDFRISIRFRCVRGARAFVFDCIFVGLMKKKKKNAFLKRTG